MCPCAFLPDILGVDANQMKLCQFHLVFTSAKQHGEGQAFWLLGAQLLLLLQLCYPAWNIAQLRNIAVQ